MPPSLSEGSGEKYALQNGNTITLEVSQFPREYPKDPIPAQPKKGKAKTYTYPEYSRALYDLNAQTDQTYCNAISQFIEQDGADADIPGFLTFVCKYGPKKAEAAHTDFELSLACAMHEAVLGLTVITTAQIITIAADLVKSSRAGTSISPSSSRQGDDSAFDEIQDDRSIGAGQLERDNPASGPAESGGYPITINGNQSIDFSAGHHDNNFRDDAYQMTTAQNLATIGGQGPASIDPNLAPASRSADNNGPATFDSASSIASRILASQALVTLDAFAPQYFASSSTIRSVFANGHPPALSLKLLLYPLYFQQGGHSLWSGWYGSRRGEGWTSNRTNLAPINGLEPLYFAATPRQYHCSGYLGDPNRSGYLFVGLDYYAGYAVHHHSGSTGGEYGNSSREGRMSNTRPGFYGGSGERTQDDGGAIPPGYERAT